MDEKEKDKVNIDDFINAQLDYLWVAFIVKDTPLMIFLTIKVFSFDFENAGRRNIVTEKDKVIEG